ncbi:MAG TPA: family 43 glycosylhydrolase [Verrucomicrobiae bacterium]
MNRQPIRFSSFVFRLSDFLRSSSLVGSLASILIALGGLFPTASPAACLTNPLMQGQDPTVTLKDGFYHLVQSDGCNIRLRRSASLGGLATATDTVIFSPGCSELWAPEIHWISNRWYLYYTLNTNLNTGGIDRRGFVAESAGTSPYGPYSSRGVIFKDYWNIDGSVFAWSNQLYYLFSGEPVRGQQKIFIAPMSNPYTLSAAPVQISAPTLSWETIGDPDVNEGPWGFQRNGRLFIVYSASVCWTDDYTLGLLTLTGTNPLNPAHWTKSGPVFTKKAGAYGPGHNCVLQDVSGQWWNVYHANNNSGEGCGGLRRIRAQRLAWTAANMPDFGSPVPTNSVVNEDADFLVARFRLEEASGVIASSTVCGRTGSVQGAPVWTNPGLKLNGSTDYVNCGEALGNDVQHALTLAAWIRADAFADWAGIITKGTNTSPYALQVWGDGSLRFSANWGAPPGGVGSGSWNSVAKLPLGEWAHAAVTYDGAAVRFYLNGMLDLNQPGVALRFGVVNEPLFLGADFPGGDEFFNGTIRDARVYGRALTGDEIAALANRPPALLPVADRVMGAGQTLVITNIASDPDAGQTLTFSLLTAPVGASVNPTNGVFMWRPTVAQAGSTNPVSLKVSDSATPSLSATQSFSITVTNLIRPRLGAAALSEGAFQLIVDGDRGPEYVIQTTSNLSQPIVWETQFTTNPPALPFAWTDSSTAGFGAKFYRVRYE